ncbi:hypothetical protein AM588_10006773 [Phytophthora nicotianae]|uniref:PiggyBac transposable element-derived protein domain-containing protein n=1 Tax=Phytophthora nicotianae TaxID=4792 RepID=A0A0W8DCC4_PHYNI|nr:hypothetical protein AM588_10006773 [Phytophthora nicotianae]
MQGVDRLDQIRGRFSTADGHSYKRWNKKLALALIDVARSNAYLTRHLVQAEPVTRDPHRKFVMELVGELLNGQWKNAPSDGRMLYSGELGDEGEGGQLNTPSSQPSPSVVAVPPTTTCSSVASRQIHAEKSRKRRRCIVCRWEGRYPTEVINYCLTHGVGLCRVVHDLPAKPWMCPSTTSTCWDKFHQLYYPNALFTERENVRRHSKLAKLKDAREPRSQAVRRPATARQIAYGQISEVPTITHLTTKEMMINRVLLLSGLAVMLRLGWLRLAVAIFRLG